MTKPDYDLLCSQLDALAGGVTERVSNLANAASLLWHALEDINWAGFYLLRGDALALGPFMGSPACVRIALGKGVCGTAAQRRETLVVPDVHRFPGHIACDAASRSEIVVPLTVDGALWGVLDIDSPLPDRFSDADRQGLEAFARTLERALSSGPAAPAAPQARSLEPYHYHDVSRRGTVRRVDYVGAMGKRKYALVYLPWGYDDDPGRRWDILYLMHGGGGSPDAWLDACPVKNMLDHAFAAGEAKPMIVVFPGFYADGARPTPGTVDAAFEHASVLTFQKEELTGRLLPAVEGAVRGYAEGTSPAALKAARAHRGFGGFSMGGVNTWYAFALHLDYFSAFVPLSGDCWALEVMGGAAQPEATAAYLGERVGAMGFGPEDFSVWAATGTKDIAYPSLTPQIEAMKALDGVFRFSGDFARGNLHYLLGEGMVHSYDAVCRELAELLPYLFRR